MKPERLLSDGFWFGVIVLKGLGCEIGWPDIRQRLEDLASGDVTLSDGPEDIIRSLEKQVGKTMPPDLRESVYNLQKNRKEMDAKNSEVARDILRGLLDPEYRY